MCSPLAALGAERGLLAEDCGLLLVMLTLKKSASEINFSYIK